MSERILSVFDGTTFVVGDGRGDIATASGRMHGFFCDDTRFISRWVLTLDGRQLDALSASDAEYFAVQFFLVPDAGSVRRDPALSLMRRRLVRGDWIEELAVMNHGSEPVALELGLEVDTDFADLFEVKDGSGARAPDPSRGRRARAAAQLSERRLVRARDARDRVGGRRGLGAGLPLPARARGSRGAPAVVRGRVPTASPARSDPQRRTAAPSFDGRAGRAARRGRRVGGRRARSRVRLGRPRARSTSAASSTSPRCAATPRPCRAAACPRPGLPWFMALFGRDSLIASYQALPFVPELARTTLLRAGRPAGASSSTTSATRSPARSCTSCASASSPCSASARTRPTTAAPTPPRCS